MEVKGEFQHRVLGSTLDDAAGECFDKVGKLIGLAYPAGPEMDRLAAQGNPRAHAFPRPMLHEPGDDFSFSGLKTSVRHFLEKNPAWPDDPARLRDLCASVQAAIVDVLAAKTIRAALRLGARCVTVSGGVACNSALRRQLAEACRREGLGLRLADKKYSTDNAAMIAILAERKLLARHARHQPRRRNRTQLGALGSVPDFPNRRLSASICGSFKKGSNHNFVPSRSKTVMIQVQIG